MRSHLGLGGGQGLGVSGWGEGTVSDNSFGKSTSDFIPVWKGISRLSCDYVMCDHVR